MAEELDDLEFLLPSELLTDDDLLTDFKIDRSKRRGMDEMSSGFGNSLCFSSDLSSPVDSVTGTTETEIDECDFVTELNRKVSQCTLEEMNLSDDCTTKGIMLSSSPQSTLCGYKHGSRGSPNSVSGVCSPPDAKDAMEWELLYAAAGEVARLQMIEDTTAFYSVKHFAPPPKPVHVTAPPQNTTVPPGFYHNQSKRQAQLAYQQLQAAKFQQMKQHQHQSMNNGVWSQGTVDYQLQNARRNGCGGKSQNLSVSVWPTLQKSQQQQPESAMRAVFLRETGAKKERIGTGVFMPRRFGSNPTEIRKKPSGCSTVLLPDRVVRALNLNINSIDAQAQRRSNGSFTTEYDIALEHRSNAMLAQHKINLRPHPVMNQEFRLPQEWTY